MPLNQLDVNFKALTHPELVMTLGKLADSLLVHPVFKEDWPSFVPHPTTLKEQVADFQESVHAAANGDRLKMSERAAKRDVAVLSGTLIAQYLVMRALHENNTNLLNDVGLKRKTKAIRNTNKPVSIVAPTGITVKDGPVSGTVIARCNRMPGAANYEVQVTVADPASEDGWHTVGHFLHCRSMEVKGLEPATKCNFRIRCHGPTGPGPWSATTSFIIR